MAFSQKLSLRAYSFSFKKWKGKNPEQILPLNAKVIFNRLQDGEERTYVHVLLGKHADTGNVVRNQTAHAGDSAVLTSMYSAMRRS